MTNLYKKIAVGVATSALLAQAGLMAPLSAFAAITVTVSGNGSGSTNDVLYTNTSTNAVTQTNTANVTNNVTAEAETGDNDANDNTGGDVSVETGNATTTVSVATAANSNSADTSSCDCPDEIVANISGNGSDSTNGVNYANSQTNVLSQFNTANVNNTIDAEAETGDNDANRNTGGEVSVNTGNSSADVVVYNDLNINDVNTGTGGTGGLLTLGITGNGSGSSNHVGIANTALNAATQTNASTLLNNLTIDADSGDNDANDNTGGDVTVETGNAVAGALVDNAVNFNEADLDGCCVEDGTVEIMDNGSFSTSDVDLIFATIATPSQFNTDNTSNTADVEAETGENDADANTQGEVDVTTGGAINDVVISNDSGINYFSN